MRVVFVSLSFSFSLSLERERLGIRSRERSSRPQRAFFQRERSARAKKTEKRAGALAQVSGYAAKQIAHQVAMREAMACSSDDVKLREALALIGPSVADIACWYALVRASAPFWKVDAGGHSLVSRAGGAARGSVPNVAQRFRRGALGAIASATTGAIEDSTFGV